ncbi:RNA polymerase sigma factor [Conexibacter stalactiti]|uniref:RNA polymerase sigma factor n=1 Tax=Conexibacter stalactiti TaxID=1940611 RepID=A0ABU4HZ59_9ACTN|nr:RNA polymerase sigma factor [Conexibacter stalactiti]MDW5598556.1 RNA polymerase sigma factor [Conexibacter stalactiti]MEC5039198.1 RNA polymerase sigma factor [Conexibacter stalactiti]
MPRLDPQALVPHLDRLSRTARALCRSDEEAQDLVQETLTLVLTRPRRLRDGDELAYLLSALRNTFLMGRRSAARRPQEAVALDDVELCDQRAGARAEAGLERHELFAAIERLPHDFRMALVAVDLAGLSYREAADTLGTCESTVATRLHRARARVVEELELESAATARRHG